MILTSGSVQRQQLIHNPYNTKIHVLSIHFSNTCNINNCYRANSRRLKIAQGMKH